MLNAGSEVLGPNKQKQAAVVPLWNEAIWNKNRITKTEGHGIYKINLVLGSIDRPALLVSVSETLAGFRRTPITFNITNSAIQGWQQAL